METNPDPIRRLFRLAQEAASSPPSLEPGTGFATRVLARVRGAMPPEAPWARLALRALPLAALTALFCLLAPLWTAPRQTIPEHQKVAQAIIQTALEP